MIPDERIRAPPDSRIPALQLSPEEVDLLRNRPFQQQHFSTTVYSSTLLERKATLLFRIQQVKSYIVEYRRKGNSLFSRTSYKVCEYYLF